MGLRRQPTTQQRYVLLFVELFSSDLGTIWEQIAATPQKLRRFWLEQLCIPSEALDYREMFRPAATGSNSDFGYG